MSALLLKCTTRVQSQSIQNTLLNKFAVYTALLFPSYIDNMRNFSSTSSILLRRSAAFLYDCLLLIAIYFVVTAVAITFNDGQAIEHFAYKFLLYAIAFLFFDWFWMHGGQTLGMRAWKIKLSATNDTNLSHKHCLFRYVFGSIFFVITLFYAYVDKHGRTLHDRLSNTKITKYIK